VTEDHPDLDAVVCNSGIQRGFNFSKPETVDLSVIEEEVTTNYTAHIFLSKAFLPFLMTKGQAGLVYTSSALGLVAARTTALLRQFCIDS